MPVAGFCFSFPLRQISVNHGTLIKWNKGFTNPNAVGEDPTQLLEAALARQGMQVSAMHASLHLLHFFLMHASQHLLHFFLMLASPHLLHFFLMHSSLQLLI